MSQSTYAITGIPLVPGQPLPTRKEITAWYNNDENALQVSLFIQALTAFQKIPVTDQLSYFRVAGIHGFPVVSWDGVTNPAGFYCAHQLPTFPTWHRPYVALYEQRLYEIMLGIIDQIPADQKAPWQLAASQWRLPYWDWAALQPYINNYGLPELLTLQKVNIMLPNSKLQKVAVDNPLWKFTNPSGTPMGDPSMGDLAIQADANNPWDQCVATSRYGIVNGGDKSWVFGVENFADSNNALQNPAWYAQNSGTIGELVYRLFTPNYFKSWEFFASTKYYSEHPDTDYLSLEYIHNNIHVFTGGGDMNTGLGHMCDPPVAAFDPIFWLHHCNVDRQTAIFQTLNSNLWFDQPESDDPQSTDPLQPFHYDTQNSTYTSDMVRDWTKFNYTYDNLVAPTQPSSGSDAVQPQMLLAVQPQPAVQHAQSVSVPHAISAIHHSTLKRALNGLYGNTRKDLLNAPGIHGLKNDYIINIVYDRYALGGKAYTIHFFLGNPPSGEVSTYSRAPNHVGCVYTFSSQVEQTASASAGCRNCAEQKKKGVLSTAQVPITSALLSVVKNPDIPQIQSLEPEGVENYLTTNLHWRAVEVGGIALDMSQLPATKIFVMKGVGDHPDDDTQLSRYHSYTPMWNITRTKVGGAGPGDGLVPASGA